MTTNIQIYLIWLIGVIAWNFGFPAMSPIADVADAVVLAYTSQISQQFGD